MNNLIEWWKSLSHNWKKTFLVNLDYNESKIKLNTYPDLYNQYKTCFGIGIRQRLDEFLPTIENIEKIISLETLIIDHIEFKDINPVNEFRNLKSLIINDTKIINLENLNLFKLENLCLCGNDLNSLKGIEKFNELKKLKLGNCRQLINLNEITECKNLKVIDLSNLGKQIILRPLVHLEEIKILYRQLYPNEIEHIYNTKFNKKRLNFYEFDSNESSLLLNSNYVIEKDNFIDLIQSNKFRIQINEYLTWTLIKTTAKTDFSLLRFLGVN
ncbi:hypothetical protein BXU11_14000 [Flavobacterium sp. LM5]|uniref:hypothetical protein n=1 Tax=Flavobacterium sp. LM5 TaxID=1938610 RepID=UPI0009928245|nr:hypothetical protein [Flavobacterium sp. LM5]OOV25782.1 hypothetical protein BXU11_14000 [Flavobacterium sp. LM5]